MSSVFDGAAVRARPAESLHVDLEDARKLLDTTAHHEPPGCRVLAGDLEPGRGCPTHNTIAVGGVEAVASGQLGEVEVTRARVGE